VFGAIAASLINFRFHASSNQVYSVLHFPVLTDDFFFIVMAFNVIFLLLFLLISFLVFFFLSCFFDTPFLAPENNVYVRIPDSLLDPVLEDVKIQVETFYR
jgi:hypothetical protein